MTLTIKLSILLMIARLFSPYKWVVCGIQIFSVSITTYYIISLGLKVFVCTPISAYWERTPGRCLNQSAIITADSIISTVTDAIMLILPLPLTWSLEMHRTQKLRVGAMLAFGGLATAFSAWRLNLLVRHGRSMDTTILFVQVVLSGYASQFQFLCQFSELRLTLCSNAESAIALICTCLPAAVAQFKALRKGVMNYGTFHGSSLARQNTLTRKTDRRSLDDEIRLVAHVHAGKPVVITTNATAVPRGDPDETVTGIRRQTEVVRSISPT